MWERNPMRTRAAWGTSSSQKWCKTPIYTAIPVLYTVIKENRRYLLTGYSAGKENLMDGMTTIILFALARFVIPFGLLLLLGSWIDRSGSVNQKNFEKGGL
jgi:hypothetical protein